MTGPDRRDRTKKLAANSDRNGEKDDAYRHTRTRGTAEDDKEEGATGGGRGRNGMPAPSGQNSGGGAAEHRKQGKHGNTENRQDENAQCCRCRLAANEQASLRCHTLPGGSTELSDAGGSCTACTGTGRHESGAVWHGGCARSRATKHGDAMVLVHVHTIALSVFTLTAATAAAWLHGVQLKTEGGLWR